MSRPDDTQVPILEQILHPSDFTEGSGNAFAHALRAALVAQCRLILFHVETDQGGTDWSDFPGVRDTLKRWGLIAPDADRSAVPALGIEVRKVVGHDADPVHSILHYLERHPVDLIVLAPHQHAGASHWLHRSVAEPVARRSGTMTLFVPHGVPGFVALETGAVALNSVVIPLAATPDPRTAINGAARLVQRLQCPAGTFTLLHVGEPGSAPAVPTPEVPGWTWNHVTRPGDVIETILGVADETAAGLIVMATDGRNGFLDALRGSHSERVVRRAKCPVLAIPQGAAVERSL